MVLSYILAIIGATLTLFAAAVGYKARRNYTSYVIVTTLSGVALSVVSVYLASFVILPDNFHSTFFKAYPK